MDLKKLFSFGGGDGSKGAKTPERKGDRIVPDRDDRDTIDELIILENYEEAEARLKTSLKNPPGNLQKRLGLHLKLGEVYEKRKRFEAAVDQYLYVADELAREGFYSQGIAALGRARHCAPLNDTIPKKIEKLQVLQDMERSREMALAGLRDSGPLGTTAALTLQRLWHHVAPSALARNLPPQELQRLFSAMTLETYRGGATLFHKGDAAPKLLFLIEGTIQASTSGGDETLTQIREFGPGDVIGESTLLEHKPWPADYRTAQGAKALVLDREGLERTFQGNPDPRGFLTALRMQHNDQAVISFQERIRG